MLDRLVRSAALLLAAALATPAAAAPLPTCPELAGLRGESTAAGGADVQEKMVECAYVEDDVVPWPVGRLLGIWQEGGALFPSSDLCSGTEVAGIDPALTHPERAAMVVISPLANDAGTHDRWAEAGRALLESLAPRAVTCAAARGAATAGSRTPAADPPGGETPPPRSPVSRRAPPPIWKPRVVASPNPTQKTLASKQQKQGDAAYFGKNRKKDRTAARKSYQSCAVLGNADCMYMLGFMMMAGQGGAKDPARGIGWLAEGARRGEGRALSDLGDRYQRGDGVPDDDARAVELFREAAAKKNTLGMYRLGEALEKGLGVRADSTEAFDWYAKAARAGSDPAKKRLRQLGKTW